MDHAGNDYDPRDCVASNLRAATRTLTRRFDDAIERSGVRSTQFPVLNYIAATEPCGVADLAAFMSMDVSTATRNLQPLTASGLVTVREDPDDRRRREIRLTAKGRRALRAALDLWSREQHAVAERLGRARYEELLATLALLRD
jgi:DNA-binding MarR family transcriptional regulator